MYFFRFDSGHRRLDCGLQRGILNEASNVQ
nr:MAG TPA: hypothetical protein [Caudoviricetes sp.]